MAWQLFWLWHNATQTQLESFQSRWILMEGSEALSAYSFVSVTTVNMWIKFQSSWTDLSIEMLHFNAVLVDCRCPLGEIRVLCTAEGPTFNCYIPEGTCWGNKGGVRSNRFKGNLLLQHWGKSWKEPTQGPKGGSLSPMWIHHWPPMAMTDLSGLEGRKNGIPKMFKR